jgi:hypothetical protein
LIARNGTPAKSTCTARTNRSDDGESKGDRRADGNHFGVRPVSRAEPPLTIDQLVDLGLDPALRMPPN